MSDLFSLRGSVGLHLEYEDRSPFGTMISGQLEARLKSRLRPAIDALGRNARETIERAPSLLADILGSNDFHRSPRVVREDLAHPAPTDARPAALRVDPPGRPHSTVAIPAALVGDLASWMGEWQRGSTMPVSMPARDLWTTLSELGCFEAPREPSKLAGAATFVGHATVLLSSGRTKILIDPFLLPSEESFPRDYQPLTHGDLAPDAVLITHSHRDHFHVDSLLRLGKDIPVFVPEVSRESALAVDMVQRLQELGFRKVTTLRWHEETTIGDFRVIALPFYGEQPTTESVLHPEIRNAGNNYLVEGGGRRYAFVADAGRDHAGDVRSLATEAFERYGAVDVLFGGYRAWSLYPIQYVMTSVPQYLLFTPPSLWGSRQQIMNDAHALLDTAERWHARYVVPYADGGAPWYWQLGLGPRSDASSEAESAHFDSRPEGVLQAAAERSSDGGARPIPSATRTVVMRPGESLDFDAEGAALVLPNPGHLWPYAEREAVRTVRGATGEPVGLSRKRVLLRLLANEEMKRRGLAVNPQLVQAMSDELRRDNHLVDRRAMISWLERVGLTMAEYTEILVEWQGIIQLEGVFADAIEKRVGGQRAFVSMRDVKHP